jgi:hypothetical protein
MDHRGLVEPERHNIAVLYVVACGTVRGLVREKVAGLRMLMLL